VGGAESGEGRQGRGALTKCVVAVAVEHTAQGEPGRPPVPGFAALQVLPDASSKSIDGFLQARISAGSRILSDGWGGYRKLDEKGFEHTATVISGQEKSAHTLFPWVHISLSNLKRFLLGTHHQVQAKHLKRYVAEFNYRLNRRTMEKDMLTRVLRACLGTHTITFQQLIDNA